MFDYAPLWISLRASVLASIIVFVLGTLAARLCLNLRGRFVWLLDVLFTLPMVLPPTVLGFFLLVLFGRNSFLGGALGKLGIPVIFSWHATVVAAVVVSFPLMYKGAKGALEQVDMEHVWAARTLGMSEFKLFLTVMLPEAWPGILAGLALSFARALGEFGATLMIAGNIPGKTQTIPMAIYFATAGGDMETAWIWVGVITIVSCVALAIMNHLGKKERS
ncbi:MAG: molybdate ABC transporter permease subunit [Sphaerochaetaceae bacterium]|nr:molybdate ABC transporter permease subunit [Sphaerochaetaceae bacterium]